jgi:hypothetical protein
MVMERKRRAYLAEAIMDLWVKEEKKLPSNIAKMIEAMLKKVLFEILKTESKLTIEETEEEKKRLESVCIHEVIRISRTLSKKKVYTEEMKELMRSIMFYVRMVIDEPLERECNGLEGEDAGEE